MTDGKPHHNGDGDHAAHNNTDVPAHHHEIQPQTHHMPHYEPHGDLSKTWKRTVRTAIRTATYAALARIAFGIVKSIMKAGVSKRLARQLSQELLNLNAIKWATVLGGLSFFRFLQQFLVIKAAIPTSIASFMAGCISSMSVMVMNSTTRTELALYLFVRAFHGFLVANVYPRLPKKLQEFRHYDMIAMMLTASEILYCAVFEPKCHSKAYQSFLVNCTMQDQRLLNATAGMHRGHVCPDMVDYAKVRGVTLPADKNDMRVLCNLYHPNTDCNGHLYNFVTQHMKTFSLPLYVPLKVVSTLLFSWKKVRKEPVAMLTKVSKNILSSSLFLTLYCAGPFRMVCFFQKNQIRSGFGLAATAGLLGGIPTLLEPKSRRLDLALYCGMHALRSSAMLLSKRGWIAKPTQKHVWAMYIAAIGYILHQYDHMPLVLHPNLRSGVGWLLKEAHHAPSHRTHGPRHHHHHHVEGEHHKKEGDEEAHSSEKKE